jgi:hypothetical protein
MFFNTFCGYNNLRSFTGQAQPNRLSDTATGAGDEYRFVFKFHMHLYIP